MKKTRLVFALLLVVACDPSKMATTTLTESPLDAQLRSAMNKYEPLTPLVDFIPNPAWTDLGQALFFDKILSGNRDMSCATCHDLEKGAGDGMSLAVGTGGTGVGAMRAPGPGRGFVPRNAPSLLSLSTGSRLLWDGRLVALPSGFTTSLGNQLVAQAFLPVVNRAEMRGEAGDVDVLGNPNELAAAPDDAAVWAAVMQRLLNVQAYVSKFNAAFPGVPAESLGATHVGTALAAFEIASFSRHSSPFDRYLANDNSALTDDQKRGGLLFFERGCRSCHNGISFGGSQFVNIGAPQIGPGVGSVLPLDRGRREVDSSSSFYDFAFRAPSLRNVELTAPYMHSGAYSTLDAVLRHYNNPDSALRNYDVTQVRADLRSSHHGDATSINAVASTMDFRFRGGGGIKLTATERALVIAFLKALTDPAAGSVASLIPTSVPSGLPVR